MSRSSAGGVRDLDGKVAWVTGSSRGIGAAVAQLFAQRGAHVAVHGRDRQSRDRASARTDRDTRGRRDIAQAALFLASDQSEWISGIVVDVAGGVAGYSFS
jgi:NAD(P)-dependent dehydrogenase (short-subunit alcohol dehydrogenase family)